MKKIKKMFFISSIVAMLLSTSLHASDMLDTSEMDMEYYQKLKGQNVTLNVYNWGEYISDGSDDSLDLNKEFEALTGIKVNYTTYGSNEEMYVKIKLGGINYDIIIPSDYTTAKLIEDGLVQKLDFSQIPNFKYIDEDFINPIYDPTGQYSVPYAWGITGIIYNTTVVDKPESEISWDILFDKKYEDQILMYYNPRDAFAVAAAYLGYSLNTTNENEIRHIAQVLKEQKPIVQAYVMDEIYDKMESGEAAIGVYYAGDSLTMIDSNPDLNFVIPTKGANLYTDTIAIPANAENVEAAHIYINFLNEPEVAAANIDYIQYASPNTAAIELLDDEVRENEIIYPSDEIMHNAEIFLSLPNETTELVSSLWSDILSTDETYQGSFIPILLISIILVSIIITRLLKKRRR